jgi:hypothetical protein
VAAGRLVGRRCRRAGSRRRSGSQRNTPGAANCWPRPIGRMPYRPCGPWSRCLVSSAALVRGYFMMISRYHCRREGPAPRVAGGAPPAPAATTAEGQRPGLNRPRAARGAAAEEFAKKSGHYRLTSVSSEVELVGEQALLGGVAEGSRANREMRYGPTQSAAMRCRPETPKTKRCAVGSQVARRAAGSGGRGHESGLQSDQER